MGWLRKKAKQIAGAFRKVGRKLKKGLGKVAKAFGKLGPLGSIALSFILPGIGSAIGSWFGGLPASNFLVKIVNGMKGAFKFVKGKVGTVFNKVTDAIEWSMNKVGGVVGKGDVGSNFRNFVSDVTGGFIEKSEFGTQKQAVDLTTKVSDSLTDTLDGVTSDTITKTKDIIEPSVDTKIAFKDKSSIFETVKDKDLKLKDKIITSKEYAAYKPIEATRMAGAAINEGEAAYEAQVAYHKAAKSDYFKTQASYQLGAVEQQNYSHVGEMPMFVDYSNFTPDQDPARQYLSYRGITDYINPVDIGGYGFDYEQFLQSQLTA